LGSTRTPFAVKGGGHTSNPGFSSTQGVQISMTRFKDIKVDSSGGTVEIGSGLSWDKVYSALEPYERTVVGARIPGVGVAGCALGGCRRLSSVGVPNGYRLKILCRLFVAK
jgi:FAD/FMN-containing dehydrogenase